MVLHGVLGHEQRLRDLAIRPPLGDEFEDLALARGQRVVRLVLGSGDGIVDRGRLLKRIRDRLLEVQRSARRPSSLASVRINSFPSRLKPPFVSGPDRRKRPDACVFFECVRRASKPKGTHWVSLEGRESGESRECHPDTQSVVVFPGEFDRFTVSGAGPCDVTAFVREAR